MAQKKTSASGQRSKGRRGAGQAKPGAHIPASIQRAIEAHAREWQAAQNQEAALAKELAAERERERIQHEASLAQAYDVEAELRKLALWRAECRRRRLESRPETEEPEP